MRAPFELNKILYFPNKKKKFKAAKKKTNCIITFLKQNWGIKKENLKC